MEYFKDAEGTIFRNADGATWDRHGKEWGASAGWCRYVRIPLSACESPETKPRDGNESRRWILENPGRIVTGACRTTVEQWKWCSDSCRFLYRPVPDSHWEGSSGPWFQCLPVEGGW